VPRNANEAGWKWPASLDAAAAAPLHHRVLLENDRVRVLDTLIERGDTAPLHTHRWPSAQYVLTIGHFVRRDADGEVMLDSRTLGSTLQLPPVLWSEPLPPHTLENIGDRDIHLIAVELKNPAG
jgi:hypothetical protein